MREFFLFTVVYSAFAVAFALHAGFDADFILSLMLIRLKAAAAGALPMVVVVLSACGALWWAHGRNFRDMLRQATTAVVSVLLLMTSFLTFKTAMPDVQPYFADPWLADLDAMLHFGVDPWRITHTVAAKLPVAAAEWVYVKVWAILVLALPIIFALDPDADRQRRFARLYMSAWVVCGSVLALCGLSVGPVYYDALMGGDRFAGLHDALATSGIADGLVGKIQSMLWATYEAGNPAMASGISAFPSVHVAIACVAALYLHERARILSPLGWAFLGAILLLSIHTGYHYAIDSYASIIVICTILAVLRRRATIGEGQTAPV